MYIYTLLFNLNIKSKVWKSYACIVQKCHKDPTGCQAKENPLFFTGDPSSRPHLKWEIGILWCHVTHPN